MLGCIYIYGIVDVVEYVRGNLASSKGQSNCMYLSILEYKQLQFQMPWNTGSLLRKQSYLVLTFIDFESFMPPH